LRVHPYVAAYLRSKFFSIRLRWLLKYHCWIRIKPAYSLTLLDFKIDA
jgi:hypothetical protein